MLRRSGHRTERQQKKLSLRFLQASTRAEPSRTNRNLNAVLDLTDDEQEVLFDVLARTKLASIVRAAHTVADRSDFPHGLPGCSTPTTPGPCSAWLTDFTRCS